MPLTYSFVWPSSLFTVEQYNQLKTIVYDILELHSSRSKKFTYVAQCNINKKTSDLLYDNLDQTEAVKCYVLLFQINQELWMHWCSRKTIKNKLRLRSEKLCSFIIFLIYFICFYTISASSPYQLLNNRYYLSFMVVKEATLQYE